MFGLEKCAVWSGSEEKYEMSTSYLVVVQISQYLAGMLHSLWFEVIAVFLF